MSDMTSSPPEGRQLWRQFSANRVALGGLIVFTIMVLMAIFAPMLTPQDPYDLASLELLDNLLAPMSRGFSGDLYVLGTEASGRDMYSAIVYGMRTSIAIGLASAGIALIIGAAVGLIAAFAGGWVDTLLMRLIEIITCFLIIFHFYIFSIICHVKPFTKTTSITRLVGLYCD